MVLYLGFVSLAGLLSGLFGFGGGVVIVPFLIWFFSLQRFPSDLIMIMTVSTSLATLIVTSVSVVYSHHRSRAVHRRTVIRLTPGILAVSIIGSIIADYLPTKWFVLIFALFLLWVASNLLASSKTCGKCTQTPEPWLFCLVGKAIGAVSTVMGIGGGTLSVPFLFQCRYSIGNAAAISSTCGFPIAVAGTYTYIPLGWHKASLPQGSLGYVYILTFAGIVLTRIPFAPLAAHIGPELSTLKLHRIFALGVIPVESKLLRRLVPC